jgi:hypothetical protein
MQLEMIVMFVTKKIVRMASLGSGLKLSRTVGSSKPLTTVRTT